MQTANQMKLMREYSLKIYGYNKRAKMIPMKMINTSAMTALKLRSAYQVFRTFDLIAPPISSPITIISVIKTPLNMEI